MSDQPTWYDANDPVQLKAFDDQLWSMLRAAREYREQDAGLAESTLGMFTVNHTPIWDLVAAHPAPDPDRVKVWLRIVPKGQGVDVEVKLVDADEAEQLSRLSGLALVSPGR